MKVLGFILAFLMLASTAFVGLAAANKSHDAAKAISEITKGMSADDLKVLSKAGDVPALPSSRRLNAGALVGGLGGLAAIVLLIAAFVKKDWVKGLGVVTVACAALSAAIYPYIPTGPTDGAAPRPMAVIAIVLAVLGALGALLAARPKSA
jgi:hypothetical protein